ncbi:hypothetical protein [Streptomyces sp. NPDC002520]
MPQPISAQPREDAGAADIKSLVQLGREELPPIPEVVFLEPT